MRGASSRSARRRDRSTRGGGCSSRVDPSFSSRARSWCGEARAGPCGARVPAHPLRSPANALDVAGARNAVIAGVFTQAKDSTVRTLGHEYLLEQASRSALQPPMPSGTSASQTMAVRRPSRRAPNVTRCVHGLLPLSVCSASRSLTQRTGRPVRRASKAATNVCAPAESSPRSPAHVLLDARTDDWLMPRPSATFAHAEHRLRRFPDRQAITVPFGDGPVRLERRVYLHGRSVLAPDDHVGLGQPAGDVAALDDVRRPRHEVPQTVAGKRFLRRPLDGRRTFSNGGIERPDVRFGLIACDNGLDAPPRSVGGFGTDRSERLAGVSNVRVEQRSAGDQRIRRSISALPMTSTTPATARAGARSRVTLPRAIVERRMAACSSPGRVRSAV